MEDSPQVTPHTVEFDVALEDGTRVGSLVTWALPSAGDYLRIDDPDKQPVYVVIGSYFEPSNITVYVRPAEQSMPEAESGPSPFFRQPPGAGGFQ